MLGTGSSGAAGGVRQSYQRVRRMIRALRGTEVWKSVQIDCEKILLGNRDSSWCVCPQGISKNSVVYCFGVGEEISFDLSLIDRFGVEIHAFDPTPRSILWLQRQAVPDAFIFHPYGVADFDGVCSFQPPQNAEHVSHTILARNSTTPALRAQVHRIETIMSMLGHQDIHLLKMDIEGAEYSVLVDLLSSGLRPQQILVEFHHRWKEVGVSKTKTALTLLHRAGYRIFHVSPSGEEYSFLYRGSCSNAEALPCGS